MIVAFYFFIRISIMTAYAKYKSVQSSQWALVNSALTNLNMKHYKSVKILSIFQNVKSPCANVNLLFKTFWRRFWFLNFTSFNATVWLWYVLRDVFCSCRHTYYIGAASAGWRQRACSIWRARGPKFKKTTQHLRSQSVWARHPCCYGFTLCMFSPVCIMTWQSWVYRADRQCCEMVVT